MVGSFSDKGNVREINEDYIGFIEGPINLYIIADGMGGYNAGEVASKLAVEYTMEYVKTNYNIYEPKELLVKAIKYSNEKIYKLSNTNIEYKSMGTTITACLIFDKNLLVANVGDSSCFAIKDEALVKITKDHSLVQELVDNGTITEDEAQNHPNKNIITRALGTNETIIIDTFSLDLKEISKVLLCTDGLTNELTDSEIYEIISKSDNQSGSLKLIEESKIKGGRDNISVIVFEGDGKQ
ncbi:MAG TPA: Stp1/IreP family PP2C-type Ser/Thr phosphatase [Clostridiaceae bacterium]